VSGRKPSDYVEIKKIVDEDGERRAYALTLADDETFGTQLSRWAHRWGVKNGNVTRTEPAPDAKPKRKVPKPTRDVRPRTPPDATARKKAREAIAMKAADSLKSAYELTSWFTKCLQESTGRDFAERPSGASTGDLFVVDRMEKSRYIAIYARSKSGAKVPVASVYPSTNTNSAQVRFPAEVSDFKDNDVERLGVAPIKDGSFVSKTKKLNKEGLAIAAEVLAAMSKRGNIQLPVA
jgi:hypothetical protein